MRPEGIFNPFKKEEDAKQDFVSIFENEPLDIESNLRRKIPSITLDGDTYALKFNYANLEIAKERLFELLYTVNKQHSDYLKQNGIRISLEPLKHTPETVTLETKEGTIQVYIREDFRGDESVVFRRIAYVLKRLPIKKILDEYHVQVIERR